MASFWIKGLDFANLSAAVTKETVRDERGRMQKEIGGREQPRDFKVRYGTVRVGPVGLVSASDSFGQFHDERSSDKRMRRQFAYSSVTITLTSLV